MRYQRSFLEQSGKRSPYMKPDFTSLLEFDWSSSRDWVHKCVT